MFQNQIAAQQAIYVKQQQHQQHMAATQGPQTGEFFKPPSMPDTISALHGNFGELSLKDPQVRKHTRMSAFQFAHVAVDALHSKPLSRPNSRV